MQIITLTSVIDGYIMYTVLCVTVNLSYGKFDKKSTV
jgi:hypothetical protein